VLSPVPAPTTAKFEAIAVMTGLVILFSRSHSRSHTQSGAGTLPFAELDPAQHPHLAAALASPGPPARDDLFERALRAVLTGLLDGNG
jgi:hypothetical protein